MKRQRAGAVDADAADKPGSSAAAPPPVSRARSTAESVNTSDFINDSTASPPQPNPRARTNWSVLSYKLRRALARKAEPLRSTLGLFIVREAKGADDGLDHFLISLPDCSFSVDVQFPKDRTSIHRLTGFDNTGNVRLWPGGEALAMYLSLNPQLAASKNDLMRSLHACVMKSADNVQEEVAEISGLPLQFDAEVISRVTSLVWDTLTTDWAADLIAFSQHAGRVAVNNDDVSLLMRRNQPLSEVVHELAGTDVERNGKRPRSAPTRKRGSKATTEITVNHQTTLGTSSTHFVADAPSVAAPLDDFDLDLDNEPIAPPINVVQPPNPPVSLAAQADTVVLYDTVPLSATESPSSKRPRFTSTPLKPNAPSPCPPAFTPIVMDPASVRRRPWAARRAFDTIMEEEQTLPATNFAQDTRPTASAPPPVENKPMTLDAAKHNISYDSFDDDIQVFPVTPPPTRRNTENQLDTVRITVATPVTRDIVPDGDEFSPIRISIGAAADPDDIGRDRSLDLFGQSPEEGVRVVGVASTSTVVGNNVKQQEYDSFDDEDVVLASPNMTCAAVKLGLSGRANRSPFSDDSFENYDFARNNDPIIDEAGPSKTADAIDSIFDLDDTTSPVKCVEPSPLAETKGQTSNCWNNNFAAFSFDTQEEVPETQSPILAEPVVAIAPVKPPLYVDNGFFDVDDDDDFNVTMKTDRKENVPQLSGGPGTSKAPITLRPKSGRNKNPASVVSRPNSRPTSSSHGYEEDSFEQSHTLVKIKTPQKPCANGTRPASKTNTTRPTTAAPCPKRGFAFDDPNDDDFSDLD